MKWKVQFRTGTLDGNHHGPGGSIRRNTFKTVRMNSYAKYWRLYVYGSSGRTRYFDMIFPNWIGPWLGD